MIGVCFSSYVSTMVYGGSSTGCTVCGGKGWYFCDGELEHLGHKVGDDTWHDENGWSCGFCDGAGDYDPDYEEYRCKKCGYQGCISEYLKCSRCQNVINVFNSMAHITFCTECPVSTQPTQQPTVQPTRSPIRVLLDDRGATSTGHTESVIMSMNSYGENIIVPEKTGYTFGGYFTKVKGGGRAYYNSSGICLRPWSETEVTCLYAYWIQKATELPEEEEYAEPEILPEKTVEGSVWREDAAALLYADDYNTSTGPFNDGQPYLAYDVSGTEGAIPGTELFSFRAKMGAWGLNYKFKRCTGKEYVKIIVTVPYRTQYEKANEELVISKRMVKEYSFLVPKAWSYWSIEESGMYYPETATVTNEALLSGGFTVQVNRDGNSSAKTPEYSLKNYVTRTEHVQWPEYDEYGVPVLRITLTKEEYIISDKINTPPDVDRYLSIVCKNAAWKDQRKASVRSDRYEFAGNIVLSDEWMQENAAEPDISKLPAKAEEIELTSYSQTYQSGIEADASKANGTYPTGAVITYIGDKSNVGVADTVKKSVADMKAINIHTPVACKGLLVSGTKDGVIVLENVWNALTIRIDNTGTHRMLPGYGTKNFSVALSGKSNVAEQDGSYMNQVRFPFAVYKEKEETKVNSDGSFHPTNMIQVDADTWVTIGKDEHRFFVPVTQKNGSYQIQCRTIAVNCPNVYENSILPTDIIQEGTNKDTSKYVATDSMEVTIRSFLRDFVITDTDDPAASRKLEEEKQALVLKKGYGFSYALFSQGEFYGEHTEWSITPRFFWVSEDETERQEAELYYEAYKFGEVERVCYSLEDYSILKQNSDADVILQCFSGKGQLPADAICVLKNMREEYGFSLEDYTKIQTITGKEPFIKQNGYLVINLEIRVKSEEGVWYHFDSWERTNICKEMRELEWNYSPGDVIRYDLSKSVADDYEVGGIE